MTLRDKIAEAVEADFYATYRGDKSFSDTADAILDVIREGVKPLEWDWRTDYGMICQAKTPIGTYSIHQDEDSAGGALFMYLHLTDDGDCTRYAVEWHGYFEPEELQAIAQADYTRRIISALGIDQ